MNEEILVTPPIRQSLEDANSAKAAHLDPPATEKSWYLYWQRTGDQVNLNTDKLGKLVTYGTHGGRPPAAGMPKAALYMETDRGGVIYQNIGTGWKYRAGTMFGTLSPDQRPTDLGVDDAGFDFRGTDVAREFLWSQTEWVEATAVQYGIHSGRPIPATITEGSLYVETDRGGVIYQNQAGAWHYLAGTMFGTLSPDQRPTDLGVNDGGFDFRGTDQQREFIWSQTAWVEIPGQTPWQSDIDGVGHALRNVSQLGVGTANPLVTVEAGTNPNFVGLEGRADGPPGRSNYARVGGLYSTNPVPGAAVGLFAEGPAGQRGSAGFLVKNVDDNTTQPTLAFLVTTTGQIYIPILPSFNPGGGTKQLWYDPADSNRVKFAP